MKLSKRLGFALLAVATFSSFIMKYPLFKAHQGYWDSSFILYLSKSISAHGTAPWIANWSSYFGLHPSSYPEGIPFLMSLFQQISGIFDPDSLVLITNCIEGFMAVLFSFALALAIRRKDYLFAFFVSFLFSTAPAYVQFTGWTVSGRGFIATLLPLYLLLNLFIFKKDFSMKSIVFLNAFFLVVFFSIHRMAFFVIATTIPATALTYFFSKGRSPRLLNMVWYRMGRKKRCVAGLLLAFIFLYAIYSFYSQYAVYGKVETAYQMGKLISGNNLFIILINISLTFVASGGILVPLVILYIFYLIKYKIKSLETQYLIVFFTFSLFASFYPSYFRPFESLILSLFIAMFLVMEAYGKSTSKKRKFSLNTKRIAVMLAVAILFSGAMQFQWDKHSGYYLGDPNIHSKEELTTTITHIQEKTILVSAPMVSRDIALSSDKISQSAGFNKYYVYTSYGLVDSSSLNLSFNPHAFWAGRIFLYSENPDIRFENILEKYHNLSSYDCAVIKNGKSEYLSNILLNNTYEVYSNTAYSVFFVDRSSPSISETEVWVS